MDDLERRIATAERAAYKRALEDAMAMQLPGGGFVLIADIQKLIDRQMQPRAVVEAADDL